MQPKVIPVSAAWKWGSRERVAGAAARLGADAQPCRQLLGRAADGIPHRARAGREDRGEADKKKEQGEPPLR